MVDTKKLEEAATRLNTESDFLNATLQKIQDKVNSFNIGLEVWADTALSSQDEELREDEEGNFIAPFPDATSMVHKVYLGYAKTLEGWRLAIQEREVYYGPHALYNKLIEVGSYNLASPQPLLKASREVRIAALKHLPSLIEGLRKTAEAAIQDIEKARQLADEL